MKDIQLSDQIKWRKNKKNDPGTTIFRYKK